MMPQQIDLTTDSHHLSGFARLHYFRPDLVMKYTEVFANQEVILAENPFQTGLRLVLTFAGCTEIQFGQALFRLHAQNQPQAAFLPVQQPTMGRKIYRANQTLRELVIFIYPKWLEESGLSRLKGFYRLQQLQSLQAYPVVFTQRMWHLAETLLETKIQSMGQALQQEATLLNLLAEAINQLPEQAQPQSKIVQQIQHLTERLDQGALDHATLDEIAKQFHTNVTSLQKAFQARHHITIGAYLRQRKLERAYTALLQGASVTFASELAGYTNPDNFSVAFRKRFGLVPSKVKQERMQAFLNG